MASKTTKKRAKAKASATAAVAPGQALGYYLQETLLTHRLLVAKPGSYLSLEVLDDVALHQDGAPQELVQTTSTSGNNPVADRDPKLWKTLSNWINVVAQHGIDPSHVRFVLYVSAPASGPLVRAMSAASDQAEAQSVLAAMRDALWGPAPEYPKRSALSLPLAKFANAVLSAKDETLIPLIVNFELQNGSGSPHGDFIAELAQQIILEQVDIEVVAPQMLGWVKQKLELSLEKQVPAIVSREEFVVAMRSFIRATAFRHILTSFASIPTSEEKQKHKLKTYVRQLELIELDETRILGAITDFLMSASERVEWAARGLVTPTSFDDLDVNLRHAWDNHGLIAEAAFSSNQAIPRGRSLYANCMNHQAPVQGMTAPPYFVRGCFHRLADGKQVGWHQDFMTLLVDEKA